MDQVTSATVVIMTRIDGAVSIDFEQLQSLNRAFTYYDYKES